jgi:hypothetical protein
MLRMRALTVLAAIAAAAGAPMAAAQSIEQRAAQSIEQRAAPVRRTLEDRAAQVRQTLEDRAAEVRRTIESPPPVETVIDRGTRVLGQPPGGTQTTAAPGSTDSRLTGEAGVSLAPGFNERMSRVLTGSVPGVRFDQPNAAGAALIADPRGAARLGTSQDLGAPTGMRNYAPGVLVIPRANDGQVTGVSNLFTGNGRTPGVAP